MEACGVREACGAAHLTSVRITHGTTVIVLVVQVSNILCSGRCDAGGAAPGF